MHSNTLFYEMGRRKPLQSEGGVPRRSAFAEKVLALKDEGKTPEEIARALKKNVANERAVLAHG